MKVVVVSRDEARTRSGALKTGCGFIKGLGTVCASVRGRKRSSPCRYGKVKSGPRKGWCRKRRR